MKCKKCGEEIPEGAVFCCWCGLKQERTKRRRCNGEGSVYMDRYGKWCAQISVFRDGTRYVASKGGLKTKREACAIIPELRQKAAMTAERPTEASVADLYEMLTERWYPKISKDKVSHYKTAWASIHSIHHAKIRNLRYAELQPLIDEREGGYYPKRDVKILLHKIFELALKYEYADRDYSELLELPPMKQSTRTALTHDEVARMWDDYAAGHGDTKYFLIMCYTGMRSGEMLTIQKKNVHLEEQYCTGGIKTEAGKARQIIFCDKIMPLVREAYNEGSKRLCSLTEESFYTAWHEMADRVGLKADASPYCCRHTAPTMLAEEGVQPAIIQEIMGHTSYTMTAEHYTHISLESKLEALNRLK